MHVPCRRPAGLGLPAVLVFAISLAVAGHPAVAEDRPERPGMLDVRDAAPLRLDDTLEPLPADRRRTEREEDGVEALARFSAGRALDRKGRHAEALRFYQRALRYDPGREMVVRAAVRLALQMKRQDEAVRVALRKENAEALSPIQWMELASHLRKKGDWQGAAAMYEKVLAGRQGAEPGAADVALRIELGWLYHLTDEMEKAAEAFAVARRALDHPHEFGMDEVEAKDLVREPGLTYALMGDCFLLADRTDEAVGVFEESHRAEPNKGLLGYNLARVEMAQGNASQALGKLRAYFQEHLASEGVAPYELFARILAELDKEDELVERLEKLRAADVQNVPLAYFLADAYREAQQAEKAEALYRTLVEKAPTVTGYRRLLAIHREGGRPEALLELMGQASSRGVVVESLGAEGRAVVDDAELVDKLIEIAEARHKQGPDQLGHDDRLAMAYLTLAAKRFEAAKRFFDLAIEVVPSEQESETLLAWGLSLLDKEQYATAAGVFQQGIDRKALPDDNPVLYFYLSGALELADRTAEALTAARKAAKLDPESPRFKSRVAWILYRNNRNQEAAETYTGLIERFDSDFGSAEVRQVMREARLVLSNLAVLAEDLPRAEAWLEDVLDEFPDDAAALNDLGYLWADRKVHLERAERMVRRAVEGDPENLAYRDSLGWALFRLGRTEEALVELEKAAAGDAPDAVILDHLGDAYHAAKQPEKAKKAWQRAVEAFEKSEETKKAEAVKGKIGKSGEGGVESGEDARSSSDVEVLVPRVVTTGFALEVSY